VISIGNERRTVAPTGANQSSSRSHAILVINVETFPKINTGSRETVHKFAKLQIVDLAGSERAQASDNRG
jgi:kinesin family protein 18/19